MVLDIEFCRHVSVGNTSGLTVVDVMSGFSLLRGCGGLLSGRHSFLSASQCVEQYLNFDSARLRNIPKYLVKRDSV